MRQDLRALKDEVEQYLRSHNFAVFHGYPRLSDHTPVCYWDSDHYPDFRGFLDTARVAEVKIISCHHRTFSGEVVDETLERLESCEFPNDVRRNLESRLKELRGYEGFLCSLELSFDLAGRVYLFETQTEWYEDFLNIAAEIDSALDEDEDEGEGPLGDYFSRN
jgi:hypothetical protein